MSGRGLSGGMITGLNAPNCLVFAAVKLVLSSGTFAFKTGSEPLTFDGVTFVADGTLRGFGSFEENSELSSSDVPINIALTSSALLAALTANNSTNDEVDIYIGLCSSPGVLLDYAKFGPYLFGKPSININPEQPVATLTCQRYTSWLQQVNNLMFTDESQRTRHSSDAFFSLINTLAYKQMVWGGKAVGQAAPGAPGTGAGSVHTGGGSVVTVKTGGRTALQ